MCLERIMKFIIELSISEDYINNINQKLAANVIEHFQDWRKEIEVNFLTAKGDLIELHKSNPHSWGRYWLLKLVIHRPFDNENSLKLFCVAVKVNGEEINHEEFNE